MNARLGFPLKVIALFLVCAFNAMFAFESPVKKQVLIIHSYHHPFLWTEHIENGVIRELEQNNIEYELYVEYMDTKHFSGEAYLASLHEMYKNKYSGINLDVIVCSDNAAFNFLKNYRDDLFGEVPLVFCGYNYFKYEDLRDISKVTGVSEWIDFESTLDLIKHLQPEVNRIYIISERTDTGMALHNDLLPSIKKYSHRYSFEYHDEHSIDTLIKDVSALDKNTAVLYLAFFKDIRGQVFEYDVISRISQASSVPVYAGLDFYLGKGITGGVLVSGSSQGSHAGRLAVSILQGKRVSELAVVTNAPNVLMLDYKQIERFGLPLDKIKVPYVIINKKPGIYEQYKTIVLVAVSVFAAMTILIVLLVVTVVYRKRVQRELIENRNMLSWSQSLAKVAHWSINLKTNEFQPSEELNSMFGVDLCGFSIRKIIDTFVDAKDRNRVYAYIDENEKHLYSGTIEFMIHTKDGDKCLYSPAPHVLRNDPSGEPLILLGTLQDISERHQFENRLKSANQELVSKNETLQILMEELGAANEEFEAQNEALLEIQRELIESEKKFRVIAETISDIIWIIDSDEKIQYISPPVEKLLNYRISDIYRLTLNDLFTELSCKMLRSAFNEAKFRTSLPALTLQLENIKKDGQTIWTETIVSLMKSDSDSSVQYVCVTRDLSERLKTQDYMIQTEKMSTISGLAAGMAHEINNPLSIILNAADTMLMRTGECYLTQRGCFSSDNIEIIMNALNTIKFHEYINHIVSAGKRAAQIIINMLAFSRKSQSVRQYADVNNLIDQALDLASKEYRINDNYDFNQIMIEKKYMPLPQINCIATEIEQVFLNIVKNAYQAMLLIPDKKQRMIKIETGLDKDYAFIRIADNGPGIPGEYMKNIFDPFFTTKSGIGTGLGLSISYFIITQNHKGTIELERNDGGASFLIRLPFTGEHGRN